MINYFVSFKEHAQIQLPANFDSIKLDSVICDWICALHEFYVEALIVLGPNPFAGKDDRVVLALHPPRLLEAANTLEKPMILVQYGANQTHDLKPEKISQIQGLKAYDNGVDYGLNMAIKHLYV